MTTKTLSPAEEGAFAALTDNVATHLRKEALGRRGPHSLDQHDIAMWEIEDVLRMAFEAGLEA